MKMSLSRGAIFPILALGILATMAMPQRISHAQGIINFLGHSAEYLFASHMRFDAQFESDSPLVDGHLILQIENLDELISFPAELASDGSFHVDIPIDDEFSPPAFRTIEYWFLVGSQSGAILESPRFDFFYEDNRFNWQQISDNGFRIHWYAGNEAFGKSLLTAAKNSVDSVKRIIPLAAPDHIDFYVYANQNDLMDTIQTSGFTWIAGHSDLNQDRILLSISDRPSESLEIERQIPHEMAHIMLFQALGSDQYEKLPTWLVEGIASNAEFYSDPLYAQLLELSHANQSLPSLSALCHSFPQDQTLVRVAYAEADAFVAYLRNQYQLVGMGAIVDAYTRNDDCHTGLEDLLGKDLTALETEWHQVQFGSQTVISSELSSIPWPLYMAFLIPLVFIILVWRWRKIR